MISAFFQAAMCCIIRCAGAKHGWVVVMTDRSDQPEELGLYDDDECDEPLCPICDDELFDD